MVLGMGIRFSKTIANKLGSPPSGMFAMDPILDISLWLKSKIIDRRVFSMDYVTIGYAKQHTKKSGKKN